MFLNATVVVLVLVIVLVVPLVLLLVLEVAQVLYAPSALSSDIIETLQEASLQERLTAAGSTCSKQPLMFIR